jgi:Tfp pilus assembly protein PilX
MIMEKKGSLMTVRFPTGERGAVLVMGLLIILVLTILGMAAMMSTAVELKIARNDRSSKQVFYIAEAGLEDARSRMQTAVSPSPIQDSSPTSTSWTAFVGTGTRAAAKGYQGSNPDHVLYAPLNSSMDYVATITHKLDPSGNILRWGDINGDGALEENTSMGENIYVITSEGRTPTGAEKTLKIEAVRIPSIPVPAALYTEFNTTLMGKSTYVTGIDQCGGPDVPGVLTRATVSQNGQPTVLGSPPIVQNSLLDLGISPLVSQLGSAAKYSYALNSATLTGMNWGSPVPGATPQNASSCSERNVVYFETSSTYVKLAGGTSGCGILLVNGDLNLNGGFHWYGLIIVTGSVAFSGGGEKNVTGGILSGGSVSADVVGGDSSIVYCSGALNQTLYLPLKILRWVEFFS